MKPLISVIIPTHNPDPVRLEKTLSGLKQQDLEYHLWELIIVDNASSNISLFSSLDLSWHPKSNIVQEERLGLTWARIAGIQNSLADFIVFVDDDNVLDSHYLKNVITVFQEYSNLGAIGGKSLPEFEQEPEPWVSQFFKCLALRDLGNKVLISAETRTYPEFAPIGAGMAVQRNAIEPYVRGIINNNKLVILDRSGKRLSSGGDNDMVLTILKQGWSVGYFPQLQLTHLIPAKRLTKAYLAQVNRASSRSWVQVLNRHDIQVWPNIPRWTVLPRQIKAFFIHKPWKSSETYVRWQGICGLFEGLSE